MNDMSVNEIFFETFFLWVNPNTAKNSVILSRDNPVLKKKINRSCTIDKIFNQTICIDIYTQPTNIKYGYKKVPTVVSNSKARWVKFCDFKWISEP